MHTLASFAAAILFAATAAAQASAQTATQPSSFMEGLQLDASIAMWHTDADATHYRGVLEAVNERVDKEGKLTLKPGENEIDFARAILLVCRVTKYKPQYFTAAKHIHDDLVANTRPLSAQEAFAAVPFRVQYDVTFADGGDIPAALDSLNPHRNIPGEMHSNAMRQDEPLWIAAATVDTLEVLPADDPHRAALIDSVRSLLAGPRLAAMKLSSSQNGSSDRQNLAMYAVDKAVRLGFLDNPMNTYTNYFNAVNSETAGDPLEELARTEEAQVQTSRMFRNVNVTVDGWFNSQSRTTPAGNTELFHYKWNDEADSGYSFFGRAFQRFGAHLNTLALEPTTANLASSQVYVIVSPDIPVKNPHPHYVQPQDVEAITKWVSNGGVLLIFHNDNTNTEYEHFNTLTERFGIHFNPVLKNPVEGTKWVQAQVPIPGGTTGVFRDAHLAYMKEIDTISTQPPAQPVLRDTLHGTADVYMAVAHYGKGIVFATVDPWLYNEYTDGQKLGFYDVVHFDPFPAAIDLARWALEQARKN